jgi:hypothetical protein
MYICCSGQNYYAFLSSSIYPVIADCNIHTRDQYYHLICIEEDTLNIYLELRDRVFKEAIKFKDNIIRHNSIFFNKPAPYSVSGKYLEIPMDLIYNIMNKHKGIFI